MFKRRVKVVERRVTVPDWRSEAWQHLHDGIRAEAATHEPKLSFNSHLGDAGFGSQFSCSICRTPWPCRFIRWAHALLAGRDDTFEPLRLRTVGEVPDGHGVRLPDGSWIRTEQPSAISVEE